MSETLALIEGVKFYALLAFGLCAFIGLLSAALSSDFAKLKRRFSMLNPIYYMFFAIAFFCCLIEPFMSGVFSTKTAVSFALFALILILGVKLYKISKSGDFKKFHRFLQGKYAFDILCAAFFIGYLE